MDGYALTLDPFQVPRLRIERGSGPGQPEAAAEGTESVPDSAAADLETSGQDADASAAALSAAEDARLVLAVRKGDTAAFDRLVRRHLAAAHRVAQRVLEDTHDAQDACQDAFIQALVHIESCERPEAFRAWLLTIVKNRAYNLVKSRRVRSTEPLESVEGSAGGGEDPSRKAYQGEVRTRIAQAMEGLTELQKNVVLLFDAEGWSHKEIGERLGISEGSSRVHLHVARARLRERLGALNPFGGRDERA